MIFVFCLGEAVRIVCPGMGYPTPTIAFVWRPKSLKGYEDFVKQFSPFGRNELMKTVNAESLLKGKGMSIKVDFHFEMF